MLPVVQAGAAQRFFVDPKTERPHQPQLGPHRHARPPHRAGVGRNFRLVQDDVQSRFVIHNARDIRRPRERQAVAWRATASSPSRAWLPPQATRGVAGERKTVHLRARGERRLRAGPRDGNRRRDRRPPRRAGQGGSAFRNRHRERPVEGVASRRGVHRGHGERANFRFVVRGDDVAARGPQQIRQGEKITFTNWCR